MLGDGLRDQAAGVARRQEDGVEAYVCLMLIPAEHPLASVNDPYNAVSLYAVMQLEIPCSTDVEQVSFLTASAVVGDAFEVVRNMKADCCGRVGCNLL